MEISNANCLCSPRTQVSLILSLRTEYCAKFKEARARQPTSYYLFCTIVRRYLLYIHSTQTTSLAKLLVHLLIFLVFVVQLPRLSNHPRPRASSQFQPTHAFVDSRQTRRFTFQQRVHIGRKYPPISASRCGHKSILTFGLANSTVCHQWRSPGHTQHRNEEHVKIPAAMTVVHLYTHYADRLVHMFFLFHHTITR